jgi:hypothetical protein
MPGARIDAQALQRNRQQPGRHLLAGRHHGVVFARVVQRRELLAPVHQLVGGAGHGGDHDGDLVALHRPALHPRAATLRMRSRSATEVPPNFITIRAMEPGGLLFLSTLNRTPQSFLTAKLGAEYLLRLLPVGTHHWRQFITPAELGAHCRAAGLRLADTAGMRFSPLAGTFRIARDMSVNYIAMAQS